MDKIKLIKGDITKLNVDAIVNAANSTLMGGGGVDGAIHKAAGKELLEECKRIRKTLYPDGLPAGEAVITKAYKLPSKFIIHTVGPVWRNGNYNENEILSKCYKNCLKIAFENNIKSIAFPAISTGVYRFPVDSACKIAIETIKSELKKYYSLREVILVAFNNDVFNSFKNYLNILS